MGGPSPVASNRTLRPNPGLGDGYVEAMDTRSPAELLAERSARSERAAANAAARGGRTPAYRLKRAAKAKESVKTWSAAQDAAEEAAEGYKGARSAASVNAAKTAVAAGAAEAGAARSAGLLGRVGGAWRAAGTLGKLGMAATGVGAVLTAAQLASMAYDLAVGNKREGTARGLEDLAAYQENTRQELEMQQSEQLNASLRRIESSGDSLVRRMMNERDEQMSELAQVILKGESSIRQAAMPSTPSFIERYAQMQGGM
jgi:hypothetical protein